MDSSSRSKSITKKTKETNKSAFRKQARAKHNLSELIVKKLEDPANSYAMHIHTREVDLGTSKNTLYDKMKRQFANLKKVHREKDLKNLQRNNDPFM